MIKAKGCITKSQGKPVCIFNRKLRLELMKLSAILNLSIILSKDCREYKIEIIISKSEWVIVA